MEEFAIIKKLPATEIIFSTSLETSIQAALVIIRGLFQKQFFNKAKNTYKSLFNPTQEEIEKFVLFCINKEKAYNRKIIKYIKQRQNMICDNNMYSNYDLHHFTFKYNNAECKIRFETIKDVEKLIKTAITDYKNHLSNNSHIRHTLEDFFMYVEIYKDIYISYDDMYSEYDTYNQVILFMVYFFPGLHEKQIPDIIANPCFACVSHQYWKHHKDYNDYISLYAPLVQHYVNLQIKKKRIKLDLLENAKFKHEKNIKCLEKDIKAESLKLQLLKKQQLAPQAKRKTTQYEKYLKDLNENINAKSEKLSFLKNQLIKCNNKITCLKGTTGGKQYIEELIKEYITPGVNVKQCLRLFNKTLTCFEKVNTLLQQHSIKQTGYVDDDNETFACFEKVNTLLQTGYVKNDHINYLGIISGNFDRYEYIRDLNNSEMQDIQNDLSNIPLLNKIKIRKKDAYTYLDHICNIVNICKHKILKCPMPVTDIAINLATDIDLFPPSPDIEAYTRLVLNAFKMSEMLLHNNVESTNPDLVQKTTNVEGELMVRFIYPCFLKKLLIKLTQNSRAVKDLYDTH